MSMVIRSSKAFWFAMTCHKKLQLLVKYLISNTNKSLSWKTKLLFLNSCTFWRSWSCWRLRGLQFVWTQRLCKLSCWSRLNVLTRRRRIQSNHPEFLVIHQNTSSFIWPIAVPWWGKYRQQFSVMLNLGNRIMTCWYK